MIRSPAGKLQTVAVAGGTGFVGRAIVRELARRGYRPIALSHRRARPDPRPGGPETRQADVTRPETLAAALSGADAVVICLAFRNSPIEAPRRGRTFEKVDAAGTEALVAAAAGAGVRRLVYISGAGAAPDAGRHWFRAKWRAEEAVRGSGIDYTIFRPTWIFGPGDRSLNRFIGFSRWLPFVPQIGNGRQLVSPIFIDDVGGLVADALETPAALNATLEVGGPEVLTMDEVIRQALRALRRRRPILHAPVRLMKLLSRPLTLLPSPPLTPDSIDFIVQTAQVDTAPLAAVLPRRLTPLAEGLATYLGRPAQPG
jgi:uncharacterized protein YbjT (DUF2867 family)